MKNKKKIVSLTAMSLVLGSTMATANASGNMTVKLREPAVISTEDFRAERAALESGDFVAWKTVMEKTGEDKLADLLTQEKFNIIVRAYKLEASGDVSGAMTLLKNAKIPFGMFIGKDMGGGSKRPDDVSGANFSVISDAYKKGDYQAWKTIMEKRGGKILDVINEDNFAKFAQAKNLQVEGKDSEARAIMEELGLPFHGGGYTSGK